MLQACQEKDLNDDRQTRVIKCKDDCASRLVPPQPDAVDEEEGGEKEKEEEGEEEDAGNRSTLQAFTLQPDHPSR